ncbi:hypothetical protein C2R22_00115 [Salinigranum rubrum]|uniref:SpoVT-AbrB domain-containing protein n=1 Tax=Salinigranum rubrum TaxID=755307 RepID=A0A2I8VEA8_9EURY|nr:hypothetical protein C2R22_00115 [Salinigranum rubrum]
MSSTEGIGTTYVRKEGRITIPAAVRRQLDLERGDLVRIRVKLVEGVSVDD